MDAAVTEDEFARARALMVDGQVRPNRVNDPRLLAAMRRIRREAFVPPGSRDFAYADNDIGLPGGRGMAQPMVIARLCQAVGAVSGEHVLVVGAGSGYGAALLAASGALVTALEEEPALLALARAALPEAAVAVTLVEGPLAEGWPRGAPYDAILIEGAVREISPALAEQARLDHGRIVTVLSGRGWTGQAVAAERTAAGVTARPIFDCPMPPIPSLLPAPGFTF